MDPRYRFVFVIGLLSLTLWGAHAVWSAFNIPAFSLPHYHFQVFLVGSSTFVGFSLVWLISAIIQWRRAPQTGFEPGTRDEFGTVFQMSVPTPTGSELIPWKLSLEKFIPQLIAQPEAEDLHPLEQELLAFLNGYRHWPLDLNQQGKASGEHVSLYEQAIARWNIMRHLPGAGPYHRIAALAKDLALVHAYAEDRKHFSSKQFWLQDKVSWKSRCQPHGGLTAFVLSTFPAFKAIASAPEGAVVQRSLLTALRFHKTPNQLPLNAGTLARDILDYLWRADAQLQQLDVRSLDEMTPEQKQSLRDEIDVHWLSLLSDLTITGSPHSNMTLFKTSAGLTWLRLDTLISQLAPLLPPTLRQQLQLWDISTTPTVQHPSWSHLGPLLQDAGLIANEWESQHAANGCFTLQLEGLTWGPAVLLRLDPLRHAPVLKGWVPCAGWPGTPEVRLDLDQLASRANARLGDVDSRLSELF